MSVSISLQCDIDSCLCRAFLNAVGTDIVEMRDLALHYFSGSYDEWIRHKEEMIARKGNALDAKARKESHIQKTIEAAHSRGDDRLAKTKAKKLERAAFTCNIDGHKFKLMSLSKLVCKDFSFFHIIESMLYFKLLMSAVYANRMKMR